MTVKIINKSPNEIPSYATEGSAGVDLRAHIIDGSITLQHLEYKMIPTGIHIEIPNGYMAMVTPRSGLSAKYGISIVNSPGIIDSDFRGEIHVILINNGKEPFKIYNGDRIAQMIITPYIKVNFESVQELSETVRGEGGFGSTKIK